MSNKNNPLMPKSGCRARRLLTALANYRLPVQEAVLMAVHGKDNWSPAKWRQGPYAQLESNLLIERSDGACWCLTVRGRTLMDQEGAVQERSDAPPLPAANLVPPRTAQPFRPLVAASWRRGALREGALDYAAIPSLHVARLTTHTTPEK